MATKEEKPKNNIDRLDELSVEFTRNQMIPRKLEFLKVRLLELAITKKATDAELTLLEKILVRERAKSILSDANTQVLNKIESGRCVETCKGKVDNAPNVFHVTKGETYSFSRQEPIGAELIKFIVYTKERIPPSHQYTSEHAEMLAMGHQVPLKDYPKEKILIHRLDLNKGWFDSIFDIDEDLLSGSASSTSNEYQF